MEKTLKEVKTKMKSKHEIEKEKPGGKRLRKKEKILRERRRNLEGEKRYDEQTY